MSVSILAPFAIPFIPATDNSWVTDFVTHDENSDWQIDLFENEILCVNKFGNAEQLESWLIVSGYLNILGLFRYNKLLCRCTKWPCLGHVIAWHANHQDHIDYESCDRWITTYCPSLPPKICIIVQEEEEEEYQKEEEYQEKNN